MTTLFQFNTSAVDVLSGTGVKDRINDLLDDIDQEVRGALRRSNEDYDISWDEHGIVVGLSDSQFEQEYGTPDRPFKPVVRTALTSVTQSIRSRLVIRE